jgi:hypothetical protein
MAEMGSEYGAVPVAQDDGPVSREILVAVDGDRILWICTEE